ncbi:MAG: hypothetical protein JW874_00470, partial [Spirochaetales bacterium]|nr:hypothetical protein [Spirochaetales bacterium]
TDFLRRQLRTPVYSFSVKELLWRSAIVLLGVAVFIGLFIYLFPMIKGAAAPFGLLPVILAGAFFGKYAGLAMSALVFAIIAVLFRTIGGGSGDIPLDAIPNALTLFSLGVLVGWLRDTHRRLRVEIQEKGKYELSLEESYALLEKRVSERTAELEEANGQLKLEIGERVKTEQKLVASNEEKAILLKEIHHRVKNNLQIVSSLLNLQVSHIRDREMIGILNDSQLRVRSIALVHENLYQSPNLAKINLDTYLTRLINHLSAAYSDIGKRISIQIDVNGMELGIDQAVPCGLIVNELISNIFKHAFTGHNEGKIELVMGRPAPGEIYLVVRDNGKGLKKGFRPDTAESLGMFLIHSLTAQMDGNIEFKTNQGTEVCVRFREE